MSNPQRVNFDEPLSEEPKSVSLGVSPALQRAVDAMSERIKHPRIQNVVVESANGFLLVKLKP